MKPARLTPVRERELFAKWREEDDPSALHEVIIAYTPLAHRIAYDLRKYRIPHEDLFQSACEALLMAALTYDATKGKFAAYAARMISMVVRDTVVTQNTSSGVHIGKLVTRRKAIYDVPRIQREIAAEGGNPHDSEELGRRMGLPSDVAEDMARVVAPVGSADDLADETTPEQCLAAEEIREQVKVDVHEALADLDEMDRKVVTLVLMHEVPITEAAKRLGIKLIEVRERLDRGRARLREALPDPSAYAVD